MDGIETGSGRPTDIQIVFRPKGQMVGGDRRLERGEDVNLARLADLKNRSAAVADVQVLIAIESDTGGDAHALDINGHVAAGRDLVDHSFMPARYVQHAVAIEGETGGIHQ